MPSSGPGPGGKVESVRLDCLVGGWFYVSGRASDASVRHCLPAVELDHDALAGAFLGGIDHDIDLIVGHPGNTPSTFGSP